METLWQEADEIWERCRDLREFGTFVSADYRAIFDELVQLQDQVETVLEWGSGLGVVTIMASRLGFSAFGIEVEPLLIDRAEGLAEQYVSDAQFAQGSFIPDDYQWNFEHTGCVSRTDTDSRDAYDQFDMEISDFDLVYAYPWPEEHDLFLDILEQCGRRNMLFLSYDEREGTRLTRVAESR